MLAVVPVPKEKAQNPFCMSAAPTSESKIQESSPGGRFVRHDKLLGRGAHKEVWDGFDTDTGRQIAWNVVERARLSKPEWACVRSEAQLLTTLSHPHILACYGTWTDTADPSADAAAATETAERLCFATERASCSLRDYVASNGVVKLKVLKLWARQLLQALAYLHGQTPPIMHRDLNASNVFVDGASGGLRIGDFGLAAPRRNVHASSVLGTPQFMAPELFEERYTEKVDVYAFGMCLLEIASKELPYAECNGNPVMVWKRVTGVPRVLPCVLARLKDPDLRAFIDLCLQPEDARPSAQQLLDHAFLLPSPQDDSVVEAEPPPAAAAAGESADSVERKAPAGDAAPSVERKAPAADDAGPPAVQCIEKANLLDTDPANGTARLELVLGLESGRHQRIRFDFNLHKDTAESVVSEMLHHAGLRIDGIAAELASTVAALVTPHRASAPTPDNGASTPANLAPTPANDAPTPADDAPTPANDAPTTDQKTPRRVASDSPRNEAYERLRAERQAKLKLEQDLRKQQQCAEAARLEADIVNKFLAASS